VLGIGIGIGIGIRGFVYMGGSCGGGSILGFAHY